MPFVEFYNVADGNGANNGAFSYADQSVESGETKNGGDGCHGGIGNDPDGAVFFFGDFCDNTGKRVAGEHCHIADEL